MNNRIQVVRGSHSFSCFCFPVSKAMLRLIVLASTLAAFAHGANRTVVVTGATGRTGSVIKADEGVGGFELRFEPQANPTPPHPKGRWPWGAWCGGPAPLSWPTAPRKWISKN